MIGNMGRPCVCLSAQKGVGKVGTHAYSQRPAIINAIVRSVCLAKCESVDERCVSHSTGVDMDYIYGSESQFEFESGANWEYP